MAASWPRHPIVGIVSFPCRRIQPQYAGCSYETPNHSTLLVMLTPNCLAIALFSEERLQRRGLREGPVALEGLAMTFATTSKLGISDSSDVSFCNMLNHCWVEKA